MAPRWPFGVVKKPASPAITSVLVTSTPMWPARPVRGMVTPLSAGWLPDVVGRFAVRDLPHHLALVQIDRGDAAVRRLHERQALHRQLVTAFATAAPHGAPAAGRRRFGLGCLPRDVVHVGSLAVAGTRPSGVMVDLE